MVLSVVIPVYNEANHLGACLTQLHRYASVDTEIIVVDGGSADQTCAIAQQAGAKLINSSVRSRSAQMNLGARVAKGTILFFVHADTIVPPAYPELILQALKSWEMGNFRYKFDSPSRLLALNAYFTRYSWLVSQGGDKTFYIFKKTFFDLGAYDEQHVIMEEYDFILRARQSGRSLFTSPQLCTVSARKYEENSWLKIQLINLVVYNLWRWKWMHPKDLRNLYRRWLH